MKATLLFIIVFYNVNLFSQTYTLDNSFGNSGIKRFGKVFYPKKGLLINNNYYFISTSTIAKVNYNGQLVNSFGTNGLKLLQQANETLSLVNFTFENNYFYIYGSVKSSSSNNVDIFICKIDENGNYDSSFGVNGIARLDFGAQEIVLDLLVQPSGTLYCNGTRYTDNLTLRTLLLFKVNINGTTDTAFDSNGYKSIVYNTFASGGSIFVDDGNYLLLGATTVSGNPYNTYRVMLTKVDEDGNIITSYGTDGFKIVPLPDSITYLSIYEAQLFDNKFYVDLNVYSNTNYDALFIFDSSTGQSLSYINTSPTQNYYQRVDNDGLYITHYSACSDIINCGNTFNLSKFNFNGIPDTTFQNNGVFSYEFNYSAPVTNGGDSQSRVFIKEPNGKFLIAGFVYDSFNSTLSDFSAIRIVSNPLSTSTINIDNASLFPNPFDNKIIFSNHQTIKTIEVYDLIGRKIAEPQFNNENTNTVIDLSEITIKGNYFIKIVTSENKIITKKIIKI